MATTIKLNVPKLALFPETVEINTRGHVVIGGCDAVSLAEEFGTPLYVYDEAGLRAQCRDFRAEFGHCYPEVDGLSELASTLG